MTRSQLSVTGVTLARIRKLIHAADPDVIEEVKPRGSAVFLLAGIICTGETYKDRTKLNFSAGRRWMMRSRVGSRHRRQYVRPAFDEITLCIARRREIRTSEVQENANGRIPSHST